jgi:hypothetical protein
MRAKVHRDQAGENKIWPGRAFRSALALMIAATGFRARADETTRLTYGGGVLDISFDVHPEPAFKELALGWISRAATAVTVYYGQFPVRHVDIRLHVGRGHQVGPGNASGWGPRIRVTLGTGVGREDLGQRGDGWLMTHEMVHLALPGLEEEHHWLEEGLATYVEPIARARAGELTPEKVWGDMAEGMPQGEPEAGDHGLDQTPTWGRTYWGGALFCLLADVGIRKETGNTKGLEDALRGILAAGGSIESDWEISKVLSTGDGAVGTRTLEQLYASMKDSPHPVDLPALWRELGVEVNGRSVMLHDDAPMAAIRRAITARVEKPGPPR